MNKKLKIALFMSMNQVMTKYSGIMNLINKLIEDPDIDFKFLYTSNVPDSVWKFIENHKDISIPYSFSLVSKNSDAFDYIITIDPYYGPYCKGSGYNKWTTKIIYKEYGVTGIDGSTYLYKRNIYQKAWMIITDTEVTAEAIREITGRDNIIVGNPAFDFCPRIEYKDNSIIWSPHCSIIDDGKSHSVTGGRFSTFLTYKDAFAFDIPHKFKDYKFVYKLHPFLGDSIEEAKKLGILDKSFSYEDWKSEVLSNNDNVRIADSSEDYYKIFEKSSMMISDSISFMAEYLITKNPIIVLRDETSSKYSDYAEGMIKAAQYEAYSVQDLENIMNILLDSESDKSKKDARDMYFKFYKPYKISNSNKIISILKKELDNNE